MEKKKIGRLSFWGRKLHKIEKCCRNFNIFFGRHSGSINTLFLISHILLQIVFVIFIFVLVDSTFLIVGIFIPLFLFLISLERIVIKIKEEIDRKQRMKTAEISRLEYYRTRNLLYHSIKKQKKK